MSYLFLLIPYLSIYLSIYLSVCVSVQISIFNCDMFIFFVTSCKRYTTYLKVILYLHESWGQIKLLHLEYVSVYSRVNVQAISPDCVKLSHFQINIRTSVSKRGVSTLPDPLSVSLLGIHRGLYSSMYMIVQKVNTILRYIISSRRLWQFYQCIY